MHDGIDSSSRSSPIIYFVVLDSILRIYLTVFLFLKNEKLTRYLFDFWKFSAGFFSRKTIFSDSVKKYEICVYHDTCYRKLGKNYF